MPDIYQGQELWDFSLVDPDNRRPVDFAQRRKLLARLREDVGRNERSLLSLARQLALDPRDPRLKLFVTWRVLQFRREHTDLFRLGEYFPLEVVGPQARHVCAFAREYAVPAGAGRLTAVVIAPRFLAQLTPLRADPLTAPPPLGAAIWSDTLVSVPNAASTPLKNLFTGQVFAMQDARLPLATCAGRFSAGAAGGDKLARSA